MRLKVSNVCQLYDKTYPVTQTKNGVTFTNNGDGSVTVNGTAPTTGPVMIYALSHIKVNPGDKILMFSGYDISGLKSAFVYISQLNANGKWIADLGHPSLNGRISTCDNNTHYIDGVFRVDSGNTATNAVIKLQIFNLTEMYGAGNEPTTVEQFRQDFPNEMYEYSPVCWKKFRRLKYIANKEPVQLLNKSEFRETHVNNGITYTNNGNGTFTLNGTTTSASSSSIYSSDSKANIVKANHKYLMLGFPIASDGNNYVYFQYHPFNTSIKYYILNNANGYLFFTPMDDGNRWNIFLLFKTTGFTVNNITIKPQLFDLTAMYGAGNEPTTVAQFRADFPNELYDYNPYNYLTLNRGKFIANKEPVQLLDKSIYPATMTNKGITLTNNGDGSVTLNGTATSDGEFYSLQYINLINGHKYFIYDNQGGSFANIVFTLDALGSAGNREGNIYTCNITSEPLRRNAYFYIVTGTVISNRVYKPQIFDLTEMYGAGNEPTTVEQFRADYPNELYDYNPYNAITFR